MEKAKQSWTKSLFAYAKGEKKKMAVSVVLSVVSVISGVLVSGSD